MKVYFIRHAKPDLSVRNDATRPLSLQGMADSKLVTAYLCDKIISAIYSSPYKRTIDTIADFSKFSQLDIKTDDDFREREIGEWLSEEAFNIFVKMQWKNCQHKTFGGENLQEVQARNITALKKIMSKNCQDNIAIVTHGTALSTIINYFDKNFNYESFQNIKEMMPLAVKMEFIDDIFIGYETIDLFKTPYYQ